MVLIMMMMMMTMMMMSQSSNESYLLEYDKRNRSIARGARAGRHLERRGHIRGHQGAATGSGGCQNGLGRLALVRRPAGANLRGRYPTNIKKSAIKSASLCGAGILYTYNIPGRGTAARSARTRTRTRTRTQGRTSWSMMPKA